MRRHPALDLRVTADHGCLTLASTFRSLLREVAVQSGATCAPATTTTRPNTTPVLRGISDPGRFALAIDVRSRKGKASPLDLPRS